MRQRVVSYPKVLNLLLEMYANNEAIIKTQDAIKNLQKRPNQRASDFANCIRSRTDRCRIAHGQVNQIEIFIHGIKPQVRKRTTSYWSDHPVIDLELLARFTNGFHYAIYPDEKDNNSN